jgi:hypothetical protein
MLVFYIRRLPHFKLLLDSEQFALKNPKVPFEIPNTIDQDSNGWVLRRGAGGVGRCHHANNRAQYMASILNISQKGAPIDTAQRAPKKQKGPVWSFLPFGAAVHPARVETDYSWQRWWTVMSGRSAS